MKNIILLLLLFSAASINAQVTFIVENLPENTPEEDQIYIAGNFNGWNPGDPANVLAVNTAGNWEITLAAQPEGSEIEFKFTRGDWGSVEKGAAGEEISNRTFTFGNGDTVLVSILNWADIAAGSTAAENVFIVDDAFYMPQLDRYRKVWIYLPPDYNNKPAADIAYPVLYMHDGQNVFDAFTSFAGEWEVDETLNALASQGIPVPIVVAIDNGGGYRIDEYTPWVNEQYGGGDGEHYVNFIVETLKPYIDEQYRTLADRNNTGIMGSSLGGLISHYGALAHQDIFSKAGIFSPSYWFSDSVWAFVRDTGKLQNMRLYQMTGANEGGSQVQNTLLMHDSLLAAGFKSAEISTLIIPDGQHNEQLWRTQFKDAYLWLFAEFIATDITEYARAKTLKVFPNPVDNYLNLNMIHRNNELTLKVIDISGKTVLNLKTNGADAVDVSGLTPGYYLIRLLSGDDVYRGKFIKQ